MGKRRDTPDFKRSSRIHQARIKPTAEERELTRNLIAADGAGTREAYGQKLLSAMCARLRITPVRLHVLDKNQPHKKSGGRLAYKEYGAYYLEDQVILIANLTAVRGKVVAGKTFFDTLIHEFMHHFDRKFLKIASTPHSPGFYNRIDDLKQKLLGRGPNSPQGDNGGGGKWEPPPRGLMAAVEEAAQRAREAGRMPESQERPVAPAVGARVPRWRPGMAKGLFSQPEDAGADSSGNETGGDATSIANGGTRGNGDEPGGASRPGARPPRVHQPGASRLERAKETPAFPDQLSLGFDD